VDETEEVKAEQPEQPQEQPPAGEQQPQEAVPLDVYALLNYALALMRDFAWQAMGLVPNAATGKVERSLEQAQVAIDAASFLAEKLEPTLSEAERPRLRSMISDLKINFLQQKAKGG